MAIQRKALEDRVGRWRLLIGNVQEELESAPHLTADVRELEQIHDQVRALRVELAALQARLHVATRTLNLLADRGDRVRSRIGASLRGIYGFTSERLIGFGFKPRPRSRRAAALANEKDRDALVLTPREE